MVAYFAIIKLVKKKFCHLFPWEDKLNLRMLSIAFLLEGLNYHSLGVLFLPA